MTYNIKEGIAYHAETLDLEQDEETQKDFEVASLGKGGNLFCECMFLTGFGLLVVGEVNCHTRTLKQCFPHGEKKY